MTEERFSIPDELSFPVDDDFAERLVEAMTRPLCEDVHHVAARWDGSPRPRRCPTCGGVWSSEP